METSVRKIVEAFASEEPGVGAFYLPQERPWIGTAV
jgi:hypothetical protein